MGKNGIELHYKSTKSTANIRSSLAMLYWAVRCLGTSPTFIQSEA